VTSPGDLPAEGLTAGEVVGAEVAYLDPPSLAVVPDASETPRVTLTIPAEVLAELKEAVKREVVAELRSEQRPASSPYLTIPEAADLLRCSRGRIDNLLSARRLSRVKEGGRTLLLRAEVEAYPRVEEARR
jgi:excisionase family DNA binding protein